MRLIAFLKEDCLKIEEIIKENFAIDSKNSVNKSDDYADDRFGYQATHYVVSMNALRRSLPEFQRFAGLKAEVQVRTVLQHAWAAIDWRFRYKRKEEAPREIRRRLFRISALLDAADDEFSFVTHSLINIQAKYVERINAGDLDIPINIDSLTQYVLFSPTAEKIIDMADKCGLDVQPEQDYSPSRLWHVCRVVGIDTLSALDSTLRSVLPKAKIVFEAFASSRMELTSTISRNSPSALVRLLLSSQEKDDRKFRRSLDFYPAGSSWRISYASAREALQAANQ